MLKLKGQTESGEWVEFYLSDIETISVITTWFGDGNIRRIDTATIQPADDPRKTMLDEIRCKIENAITYKPVLATDDGVFVRAEMEEDEDGSDFMSREHALSILDEMEARL